MVGVFGDQSRGQLLGDQPAGVLSWITSSSGIAQTKPQGHCRIGSLS
jgi:hypothetical protein